MCPPLMKPNKLAQWYMSNLNLLILLHEKIGSQLLLAVTFSNVPLFRIQRRHSMNVEGVSNVFSSAALFTLVTYVIISDECDCCLLRGTFQFEESSRFMLATFDFKDNIALLLYLHISS